MKNSYMFKRMKGMDLIYYYFLYSLRFHSSTFFCFVFGKSNIFNKKHQKQKLRINKFEFTLEISKPQLFLFFFNDNQHSRFIKP